MDEAPLSMRVGSDDGQVNALADVDGANLSA